MSQDSTSAKHDLSDRYNVVVLSALVVLEAVGLFTAPLRSGSRLWDPVSGLPPDRNSAVSVWSLLFVAALLALQAARSMGPAAVTLPQAQWWLSLPLARRGFVLPDLARAVAIVALSCGLLTGLALGAVRGQDHMGESASAAVGVMMTTVTIVAIGILLQRFDRAGHRLDTALRVVVPASVMLIVFGEHLLATASSPVAPVAALERGSWTLLIVLTPLGALAAWCIASTIPRLSAAQLRDAGSRREILTVRLFSMGGASFSPAPERTGGSRRSSGRSRLLVRGPARRYVITQLRVLVRWPGLLSRSAFFAALPAAVVTVPYFDSTAALVLVLAVSLLRVTSITGSAAGILDQVPALGRLFLLTRRAQTRLTSIPPFAVLLPWCLVAFGLIVIVGAAPIVWLAMAVPVAVGLAGSAVRTGTRPDPEWASAAISTPMGAVPLGMLLNTFHGRVASLVVVLPSLLTLVEGHVTMLGLVLQIALGVVVWWSSTMTR
ncbi:DUF6297 family protein [Curtobacterium sp. HSID17257]|uniref:DUF6297 family protein n=1 Tax=Curtobacterium sp. HSID17257 TaxID=2419510 RepID=UPI001386AED7|nr:DUF6297 family protein [Curtobacterium sp. HSID17257]